MELGTEINGLNMPRAFEAIEALLTQNKWVDRKLRILAFAANHYDKWSNAFTLIRPIEDSRDSIPTPKSKHYPTLRAQIQDVSLKELKEIIEKHKETGTFIIDGMEIEGKANLDSWSLSRRAGGNIYDSRACLACRVVSNPQHGFKSGSLLDYINPYFAGPIDFVNECTGLRLSEHNDPVGSIAIVIPDIRAYFSNIKKTDKSLTVEVGGIALADASFKIKGEMTVQGVVQKIDSKVVDGKAEVIADSTPSAVRLWVVGTASDVYDEYYEPLYLHDSRAHHRNFGVISSTSDTGLQQLIAEALDSGENDTVEFKPYIRITNQKVDELIPVMLAFLNTRGGSIFMGISDEMVVKGIDVEVLKNATTKKLFDAACWEYVSELKQIVNREIIGPHEIKYDVVEYHEKKILVISVPRGEVRPYLRQDKKDWVYVRRGATNRQASREEIVTMVLSQSEGLTNYSMNQITPSDF